MKLSLFTLIFLFSFLFSEGNTWTNIKEKTWATKGNWPTSQYVFYESANDLKKVIVQLEGSGSYAASSFIYDVELRQDSIFMFNGIQLDSTIGVNADTTYKSVLHLSNDSTLTSNDGKIINKVSNDARIFNWIESYSGYQIIPVNELKKITLEKKQIYHVDSFNLGPNPDSCGLDNNSTLSEIEAIFLNEYLVANQHKTPFDFQGKKALFVTGSSGTTMGSKSDFFRDVKEWKEAHHCKISSSFNVLSDSDKNEYGYDVVITYWVKMYNPKSKKALKKSKQIK